jgi:hypothetical protein
MEVEIMSSETKKSYYRIYETVGMMFEYEVTAGIERLSVYNRDRTELLNRFEGPEMKALIGVVMDPWKV